jgi:hypothetical protein
MKALTVIVIGFGIFAYDLSFNNGEIVHWIGSFLGLA